jgi:hypothetical protein
MGFAEYFCRPLFFLDFSKYGHTLGKTYVAAPGASLAGKPMGAQA